MRMQIAIDGPAASGKSTAARGLAARLGGLYVNTGDMYRTVAWAALQAGAEPVHHPETVPPLLPNWDLRYRQTPDGQLRLVLNGQPVRQDDIRAPEVAAVAVKQAAVNAKLNGVEERLTIANSDLLAAIPQGEQADVVVANLVTNAVLALLPTLPPYLKEGGTLIASGIIDERIDEVRRAAAAVGFTWVDEQFRSGWYAVLMKR